MGKRALLIVDMQNGVFGEGAYPQTAPSLIVKLAEEFRGGGEEVIYVSQTDDNYPEGSHNWRVIDALTPRNGERVFCKKHCSAFKDTGLGGYLRDKGIDTIYLCGAVTQYCINATCVSAVEHGFSVVIHEGANAAYGIGDIPAKAVHDMFNNGIWGSYAEIVRNN